MITVKVVGRLVAMHFDIGEPTPPAIDSAVHSRRYPLPMLRHRRGPESPFAAGMIALAVTCTEGERTPPDFAFYSKSEAGMLALISSASKDEEAMARCRKALRHSPVGYSALWVKGGSIGKCRARSFFTR
jgi:hypothetical protein